jgi:hypothetical protein
MEACAWVPTIGGTVQYNLRVERLCSPTLPERFEFSRVEYGAVNGDTLVRFIFKYTYTPVE